MSEIITVKRVKKDGSLEPQLLNKIKRLLKEHKIIVIPIDGIYGILALENDVYHNKLNNIPININGNIHLVSNYSMLEKLSVINKKQYDFLHRIWPDEVDVVLHSKDNNKHKYIQIRYPRYKFIQDLLDELNEPLVFKQTIKKSGRHFIKKDEIQTAFSNIVDAVIIIEEWCKIHPDSTIIDLRDNSLKFLRKGRVSTEEIESLYFLDALEEY